MIDTPVFGFFHRARPLPAETPPPTNTDVAAGSALTEAQPNALTAHLSKGQAPAQAAPWLQEAVPPPFVFDTANLTAHAVDADQLGLAHPLAITLFARLEGADPHELDASASGIYRPSARRPAPWIGSACQEAANASIGLAAGTRILTARGEVEVERLLPGDTALALRGPALLPIAWIGRTVTAEHSVCIDAGALGPNLPRRALCVAADQPIFLEAMPGAARTLLNGSTIRAADCEGVDMFHIDVGKSEILFAEGLPLSSGERALQHHSSSP